ncbi:LGFP repeat-containing protein [Gordonia sputi]
MACQTYPPTAFQVCGVIRDKYNQMGGPASFLLYPKSNELTNPGNTGKRSEFVGGNIYWSTATGAHPVAHEFLFKWGDHGYERGFLKYPKTDEIVLSDGVSRRQEFQGGHIYWSVATGAHSIQGLIYDKWQAMNAETGVLGFPTTDEIVTPDGKGRYNTFQGGAIYWSPTTGAHPVYGPLYLFWGSLGFEAGTFGYPTGDPVYTGNNVSQEFEHGTLRLWDGNLEGYQPVDSDVITDAETDAHPAYTAFPNLDGYASVSDPDGKKRKQNNDAAELVAAYFDHEGRPTALDLWTRLYGHTGNTYSLPASTLDLWMEDATNDYGEPDRLAPAVIMAGNRDRAVAQAIARADQRNGPYKSVITSLSWQPTAGINNDHVQALGRYQMAATTVAIARPGPAGKHPVKLVQQAHIQDSYDFARGGSDPTLAQYGAEVAVDGFELGIAKWFPVRGSGSKTPWSGLR